MRVGVELPQRGTASAQPGAVLRPHVQDGPQPRGVANARAVAVHVVTGVAVFAVLAEEHVVLAQHRHLVGQQLRQRRRWACARWHRPCSWRWAPGRRCGCRSGPAWRGPRRDELLVVAAAQMGRVQAGPQRCRHGQRNRSPSRRRGRCRRESASPRTAGGVAPVHFLAGPVGALHRAHRQVERAAVQLVAADVLDRLGFHPAREIHTPPRRPCACPGTTDLPARGSLPRPARGRSAGDGRSCRSSAPFR